MFNEREASSVVCGGDGRSKQPVRWGAARARGGPNEAAARSETLEGNTQGASTRRAAPGGPFTSRAVTFTRLFEFIEPS